MKKFSIILILLMLIAFVIYNYFTVSTLHVTKVYSPMQVSIELNKNGKTESNTKFDISGVETFVSKSTDTQRDIAEKIGIDEETALAIGYYAEKYAQGLLEDKDVTIKTIENDNYKIEINVNGKNYNRIMQASPFALKDGKPLHKAEFEKQVKLAQKAQLKIYNNKSNKYHNLSCKYGQMASDAIILPKSQIPKDASACKFCEVKPIKKKSKTSNKEAKEKAIIQHILPKNFSCTKDNIKLFLTDLSTVLTPNNNCTTEYCREIVSQINKSNTSIDMALYGYTEIKDISMALNNAIRRGVNVRFVYDITPSSTNYYPDTLKLAKLISESKADYGERQYQNAIMHNKFMIFDKKTVITGSANISPTDISGFNSNAILLIKSENIADIFTQEFEQMYNNKFHNKKDKIYNKENLEIGDSIVSIYFSPVEHSINEKIIPLINNAKTYIYIPTFVLTHKQLTQALINAKQRGVDIKIILDATNANNKYSTHETLRTKGILVKTENYAGKMHSKSIIIDDNYVIVGSMNFSKSGETKNDENVLIIENPDIAKYYRTFFNYIWNKIPEIWLTKNVLSESHDSLGSCFDGIDNDFDGKIDSQDSGCKSFEKPIKTH